MTLASLYPTITAVASAITAVVIAWASGKSALAKLDKTQRAELIDVLTKSKDSWKDACETAQTERKASDERHEGVLAEYRLKVDAFRAEVKALTEETTKLKMEIAELKTRTDFKPVMDFQKSWYEESREVHKQTMTSLATLAPILERVVIALSKLDALQKEPV